MTISLLHSWRFRTLAAIAIGLTSFSVAACSSTNGPLSSGNVIPNDVVRANAKPSPTPYKYSYNTVDDEGGSTTFNELLGMNELGQVVGYYSGYSVTRGFTAVSPYTKFKSIEYPNSQSSVATGLTDNRVEVGYFQDTGHGNATLGFLRDRGLWSVIKDLHTPKEQNAVNEILGVNDNVICVGFYVDANGNDQPYEVSGHTYIGFDPPGYVSARATGINAHGDVVGWAVIASTQVTVGWLYRDGVYSEFSAPNSNDTQPTSANQEDEIAGSYVDGTGATYGFVVKNVTSKNRAFWQKVAEPDATGATVVSAINDHHAIAGYYVDAYGNTNGFVGTVANP